MIVRWLTAVGVGGVLLVGGNARANLGNEAGSPVSVAAAAALEASAPIIDEIVFVGLRRIAPEAALAQISSGVGARFNEKKIELDVKALGRLGWFGEIAVEIQPAANALVSDHDVTQRVRVFFRVTELPYLANVEYVGSRLISRAEIEKLLSEKRAAPRLGEPADPAGLQRIASTIQEALAELGHPQARVE